MTNRIRNIADERGMSLKEFARKANVSYMTLWKWVRQQPPRVRYDTGVLARLMDTYNLKLEDILHDDVQPDRVD